MHPILPQATNIGIHNQRLPKNKHRFMVGVDEVGRGALAGSVVVAGVIAKTSFRLKNKRLGPLRDSKKLTAQKRERWYRYLTTHHQLMWATSRVTPHVIDRINISAAADRAALRVVKKLAKAKKRFFAYLDGGLRLPDTIPHRALIKGDERMKIIAAASIIAKVTRDRAMVRLHKKDSRYWFDIHKGYGTKLHKQCLKKFGRSSFHRKSFAF